MINKLTLKILQEYSEARKQLLVQELLVEKLGTKVLGMMDKEGLDTIKEEYGTFIKTYRTKWAYSDRVSVLAENQKLMLDAAKKTDIEAGNAVKVESVGLTYRANEKEKESK